MGSSPSKNKYRSVKRTQTFEDRTGAISYKPYYELRKPHSWRPQTIFYNGNNPDWQSRPSEWYYANNSNATMNPCYEKNEWVSQSTIPQRYVYTEFNRTDGGQYSALSPDYTEYEHADYRWHTATNQTLEERSWLEERSSLQREVESLKESLHTQTEINRRCKREIFNLKEDVRKLDARLKTVSSERDMCLLEIKQTNAEFSNFQAGASTTERRQQQKILELQQESDDLRTRSVYGAKLLDNNSNIADLSDKNRPTKLAERFSELYDNEWTNYFEVISNEPGATEKETIQMLLKVCVTIYEHCMETSATELTELTQAIDMFNSEEPMLILKNLKDSRKKSYKVGIKRIEQTMATRLENWLKTDLEWNHVNEYWHKCLEICWLMAIQDPPVAMDTNIERKGEVFDPATYRSYTKAGQYIDFIVWPALYLTQEGSVLYKGVAQGANTP